ncbi:MAG: hypothetical protein D6732_24020 [Methanobacteriota archaeon]|nr:MAG: hypothetical protein D6732_24020 [Euryarchaeota archaeon]
MNCDLKGRSELIARYLNGELSEGEKQTFEEHYFHCAECFSELRMATSAVRLIEKEGRRAFQSAETGTSIIKAIQNFLSRLFEGRVTRRLGLVATVLFIGLVVSKILFFPVTQSLRNNTLYTENFVPNPALESLMEQTVKSKLTVLEAQPPKDASFKESKIVFRWTLASRHPEEVHSLELSILNNKQKQMYTFTVEGNEFVFENPLPSGLYYWALLSEGEMVYLSRFVVGRDN